jgi:prepilin-type N-terminal cleavage/methylation domain-containing protein
VAGFSLVEIMMVIAIISLLVALAVPALEKIQRSAKSSVIGNDFRVFATAFKAYAQENGEWPPEAKQGVVPAGMENLMNITAWTRTSPMGGKYNWENNKKHKGKRYAAAISIKKTKKAPMPKDVKQLRDIDRTIDDGDLKTGSFIRGSGSQPLFIIEP